jgi:hypothetical protein
MASTNTTTQLSETSLVMADQTTTLDNGPPPPYTDLDEDDNNDDYEALVPHKLVINAGRTITGAGNLIAPTPPSHFAEAARLGSVLLHTLARINEGKGRMTLNLTINCGTTVVGTKNVIGGNFGAKPKVGSTLSENAPTADEGKVGAEAVVAGAKRKADDEVRLLACC